jgi:membrane-associated PAP2 superfamily phosphatase
MSTFVAGLLVMGYAVAALFFLRFRRETRDRLFAFFAAAFALLALQRALLAAGPLLRIDELWYYVMRLLAFLLIIAAIVDKNRTASSGRS